MARRAREESPTGFYHVMMRGVNREKIFQLEKHKKLLIKILKEEIKEVDVEIGAYCIMDNHVHLIIKSELADLSELLKKVNIKFAMRYNKNCDRVGHVFQGRYRSEIILNDIHLIQAIRYVHRNPVKAGIVSSIENYKWHTYKEYLSGSSSMISGKIKSLVLDIMGGKDGFEQFHLKKEIVIFLDTDEEVERNKQALANNIITDYCQEKGEIELSKIRDNQESLAGIVNILLKHKQFTHREIAKMLEIDRNLVHNINKNKNAYIDKVKG